MDLISAPLPSIPSHCFLPLPPTPVLTPPPLPPRIPYSNYIPQIPVTQQNFYEASNFSEIFSKNDLDIIEIPSESPKISSIDSFENEWKLEEKLKNNNNEFNNPFTPVDISQLNISQISLDNQKVDGEMICFSGWVQIFPSGGKDFTFAGSALSKKRCWALIRQNQLCFMENDEVFKRSSIPYCKNILNQV